MAVLRVLLVAAVHAHLRNGAGPDHSADLDREIASKMRPPSTEKPLIKTGEGLYFSQLNQDRKIDLLLKRKRDGFVVEAGVSQQNSRFFEVTRNWGCLLIEGNPNVYKKMLADKRHCYSLEGSLSPHKDGGVIELLADDMLGTTVRNRGEPVGKRKLLTVHAYPLDAMLRHLGVKTVDYLSLDTEAAQSNMMATIDFDAVEIGVISVDDALAYSSDLENATKREEFDSVMRAAHFRRLNPNDYPGLYYVNPAYLSKQGIFIKGMNTTKGYLG